MRIPVNKFVLVITLLTSLVALVLGAWALLFTDSHTQYFEGAHDVVQSWGARELAMAVSGLFAVFIIRDARGYAVILAGALTREVVDFVDLFRREIPIERNALYAVLVVSVAVHATAFVMSMRAIRRYEEAEPATTAVATV